MPDCKPLAGAVVDAWQANAAGHYYRLEGNAEADRFRLRGRIKTDEQGQYRFETVMPGHYEIGFGRVRPRHIHVMASHPQYQTLVTQIYLQGEEARPPLGNSTQVMALEGAAGSARRGRFDIVLTPGRGG